MENLLFLLCFILLFPSFICQFEEPEDPGSSGINFFSASGSMSASSMGFGGMGKIGGIDLPPVNKKSAPPPEEKDSSKRKKQEGKEINKERTSSKKDTGLLEILTFAEQDKRKNQEQSGDIRSVVSPIVSKKGRGFGRKKEEEEEQTKSRRKPDGLLGILNSAELDPDPPKRRRCKNSNSAGKCLDKEGGGVQGALSPIIGTGGRKSTSRTDDDDDDDNGGGSRSRGGKSKGGKTSSKGPGRDN